MKRVEFDKIDKLFKAYMFWGEDDYFIEKYTNIVINKLQIDKDDVLFLYFDEYKVDLVIEHLSQNSLFTPINVVVIKTNKKINKKEIEKILKVVNSFDNSFVIFSFLENVDLKDIASKFKKDFVEVRFFRANNNEAISELVQIANKFNITIDNGALLHLYNMHNQNLSLSIKDLEKLSILNMPINTNLIDFYCFGLGSVNLQELIFDFFNKKDIKQQLLSLFDEGYNDIALLRQIIDFNSILIKILSYIKLNGRFDIKDIFGFNMPTFIANRYQRIAVSYRFEELLDLLDSLLELELELKSGIIKDTKNYLLATLTKKR